MTRRLLQQSLVLLGVLSMACTGTLVGAQVLEERAARSLYFGEMSMSMSFSMPHGSLKATAKAIKGSKAAKSKGTKGCPPHLKGSKERLETYAPHHGKGHAHHAHKHATTCEPTQAPTTHAIVPTVPAMPTPNTPVAEPFPSGSVGVPAPSGSVGVPTPNGSVDVPAPSGPPASGIDSQPPSPIDSRPPSSDATPTPATGPLSSTPYALSYTLDLFRIPIDTDYIGATEVTDSYVNEQLAQHFQNVSTVQFSYSNTTRDGEEFNGPNQPLIVTYTTDITVDPSSQQLPTVDEIDALLMEAFSAPALDMYLADLAALPSSNLFQSTTAVEYEAVEAAPADSSPAVGSGIASMSSATLGGIAAAGAGILIVLAGGIVALRRGGDKNGGHDAVKYMDAGGGLTVAGDTYAGSTYAGTSMDAESVQHSGWGGGNQSHFSTPSYRTHSPTESMHDGNDSGDDSPPASPRHMQTVDL